MLHPVEEEAERQHPSKQDQGQGEEELAPVLLVAPHLEVVLSPVFDIHHILLKPQALPNSDLVTEEGERGVLLDREALALDIGVDIGSCSSI